MSFTTVGECLHERFARVAAAFGDSPALRCDGQSLSYKELDARASALAADLQALGVGPDVLVGLSIDRSLDLMVGVLGILKSGGAYVPLDPDYPSDRLAYMLEHSRAQAALVSAALLPMLTLGIPGSPTAAVLLGGLLIWGLQPGPLLFVEQKDFVWGLIASMYLGNIAGLIVVLLTVPWFAAILRIPFSIIAPVILVVCTVGAYTVHSSMFDVWLMLGFGVIGYVFKKLDYPMAPLVLALVLGDMAENAFRQSLLGSGGSLWVFVSSPLVASITALALVMLLWPLIARVLGALRRKQGVANGQMDPV